MRCDAEIGELRAGRPVAPAGLDRFRNALARRRASSPTSSPSIWRSSTRSRPRRCWATASGALVVAPGRSSNAPSRSRVEHGHRLPLIAAGAGEPAGALAGQHAASTRRSPTWPRSTADSARLASPPTAWSGARTWAAWRAPDRRCSAPAPASSGWPTPRRAGRLDGRSSPACAPPPRDRAHGGARRAAAEIAPQVGAAAC